MFVVDGKQVNLESPVEFLLDKDVGFFIVKDERQFTAVFSTLTKEIRSLKNVNQDNAADFAGKFNAEWEKKKAQMTNDIKAEVTKEVGEKFIQWKKQVKDKIIASIEDAFAEME